MFNAETTTLSKFSPAVSLNQDLLAFEEGEMRRFSIFSKGRWRLEAIRRVQMDVIASSRITLFLSRYAASTIGAIVNAREERIVPHGIAQRFLKLGEARKSWALSDNIRCLYVSNTLPYKHQWHVVEAIAAARQTIGLDVRLVLVGGGNGAAQRRLDKAIRRHDPQRRFVECLPFTNQEGIAQELSKADLFIFASSCETFGISLLEAMAAGLPIASSNRSSIPEVAGESAVYFDPEDPEGISSAVLSLIRDQAARERLGRSAYARATTFTWEKSAHLTWKAIADAAEQNSS
jgi:glycosyltransferase involved in cell wall biosynthesis